MSQACESPANLDGCTRSDPAQAMFLFVFPLAVILGCMSNITRMLDAVDRGDPRAAEQLLPLVYDELRRLAAQKLAQEGPGLTLQATALVHEAYLRLVA